MLDSRIELESGRPISAACLIEMNIRRTSLVGLALALIGIPAWAAQGGGPGGAKERPAMSMTVTSTSFEHNGTIPARHTCDGQDRSPPLSWSGTPVGTRSLVLIVDDPDAPDPAAPKVTWVHWLLYNIPPAANSLAEGIAADELPPGTLPGANDWKHTGYGGPCPPLGRHRYFHKLYALNALLPDLHNPTKVELEKAMQGHVLAHAELVGVYQRRR